MLLAEQSRAEQSRAEQSRAEQHNCAHFFNQAVNFIKSEGVFRPLVYNGWNTPFCFTI